MHLDSSILTQDDIGLLESDQFPHPVKWDQYIFNNHFDLKKNGRLWQEFPPVIPYAIIDVRLVDVALSFWENPDQGLITAYRRLEDIIQKRTGLTDHNTKLFSRAFREKLTWKDLDEGEKTGRANGHVQAEGQKEV